MIMRIGRDGKASCARTPPAISAAPAPSSAVRRVTLQGSIAPILHRRIGVGGKSGGLDALTRRMFIAVRGIAADAHSTNHGTGGIQDQDATWHGDEAAIGSGSDSRLKGNAFLQAVT
jgi:hypothetical protein